MPSPASKVWPLTFRTIMNKQFNAYVQRLPILAKQLQESPPLELTEISSLHRPGVYSFSESGRVIYLGRTKNFKKRHTNHCGPSSDHNAASFAFLLARRETDRVKASYKKEGSRKALMGDPIFLKAFNDAKARIRNMDVRFVEVPDPNLQYLLELYASMEFMSEHNSFKTS